MYPDMGYAETTTTNAQPLILGVASVKESFEGSEMGGAVAENGGCKCAPTCTCNPCNCK